MKKVLFSLLFLCAMMVGAQAQSSSCSKSCAAKPASASAHCGQKATSGTAVNYNEAAAKLASTDPTIETRTCEGSGSVSYVRKETSAGNGSVKYVDVTYDATSNTFVNVAPSKMEGGSGSGTMSGKTGCGTATSGKSCCAGKSKGTSASASTNTSGQAVKTAAPIKN